MTFAQCYQDFFVEFFSDLNYAFDVNDFKQRIWWGLEPDHLKIKSIVTLWKGYQNALVLGRNAALNASRSVKSA